MCREREGGRAGITIVPKGPRENITAYCSRNAKKRPLIAVLDWIRPDTG